MPLVPDRSLRLTAASVRDHRELARRRLPRQLFDYIDGGAYEESTLRANESDLADIGLRQRVLRDVSDITVSTTVLGRDLTMPVLLAPVGLAGMFMLVALVTGIIIHKRIFKDFFTFRPSASSHRATE